METVIAIGVLAVLITAFMYVFGPAMAGIRKSINVQEADRLASTLERELGTLRTGQATGGITTGFDKAFEWIRKSNDVNDALCVYQYRGDPRKQRSDGTLEPMTRSNGVPGQDYVVQPIVRRMSDSLFTKDLEAIEGPVFVVKCTQLVYDKSSGLIAGSQGEIRDPQDGTPAASAAEFKEAVVAFSADFYSMPANSPKFFQSAAFKKRFNGGVKPIFTRNLAVRR
jgi:hypothetical protein